MPTSTSVLVAEDNEFVRMQVVKFLQEAGYGVFEAGDGTAALRVAKEQKIDVAVVDVRMEPMDGFEFIKAMQGQSIVFPVILVTGDHNPDLLSEAARWNVSAVLMKPVQKDRLLKMVSRAILQKNKQ